MLQGWLAGHMGELFIDCTEGLTVNQIDVCELDRDYPNWLSKYVDVAKETEDDRDHEAADSFESAADQCSQVDQVT